MRPRAARTVEHVGWWPLRCGRWAGRLRCDLIVGSAGRGVCQTARRRLWEPILSPGRRGCVCDTAPTQRDGPD